MYYYYDTFGNLAGERNASTTLEVFLPTVGGKNYVKYQNGTTYFLHTDMLATTGMVTDQTGTSVPQDMLYYPWGAVWAQYNMVDERFAGLRERDAESQLDPTPNRLYYNYLGRWLTSDPAGTKAVTLTDPQTWNMYAYVRNNPTTLNDPSGLCPDGMDVCFEPQLALDKDYMAAMYRGNAVAMGILAGFSALGGAWEAGGVVLRNLLGLALATAPRTVPIVVGAIEGLAPGPPGTLTIAAGTRLTAQEIDTGVHFAEVTGKSLVQSGHLGEEFVDAAGKTYDAMGGAKAYEYFGDGTKFLDAITHHVNKAVDIVIIDLKGASKGQVGTIKKFVGALTAAQQKKVTYLN